MTLRRTPLTAIVAALVTAVLLAIGTTAVATTAVATTTGAASAGAASAGASSAGAARAAAGAARSAVPWNSVGVGWVLAQYTSAAPGGGGSGPEQLYLISPGGTRYELASWPSWRTAPQLLAWSPDGRHALFQVFSGKGGVEQLTLATGQMTTFVMQGAASPIGYTTPHGLNIVAGRPSGSGTSLARYNLSGRLVQSLGYSADGAVLYTPWGTEFLTGASNGLKLVSNGGALLRSLPVPGTGKNGCSPVRWWTSSTALAECTVPNSDGPQLWLVPVSGARPAALTPPRKVSSGDLGDIDAWSLPSGLYLQTLGPCGVLQVFKQAGNGSAAVVSVPHTTGDNHVLSALGSRLLIQAPTSCLGSNSLLWFNPATKAEQWLIRAPDNVSGVGAALPFYSRQNASL